MLIDSHCHLNHENFSQDIDAVIKRAQESNIEAIINIATSYQELEQGLVLHKKYPWIYCAGATPPHDVVEKGAEEFDKFAAHARKGDLIALGETGLDYFYCKDSSETQHYFFRNYIRLANSCNLPLIVHCREAFADLFHILDEEPPVRGVLHCFTGDFDEAKELVRRGWFISISGIITFKNSENIKKIVPNIPLKNLLIETDAPFLAPGRHRGTRNEPAYLVEIVALVAQILGLSIDEVARATSCNASSLFGLRAG